MGNDFNIDDLLAQAQRLKEKNLQGDFPLTQSETLGKQSRLDNALETASLIEKTFEPTPLTTVDPEVFPLEPLETEDPPSTSTTKEPTEIETFTFKQEDTTESIPVEAFKETIVPDKFKKPAPAKTKRPKKTKRSDEKGDLFEFQPEKREKPIVTNEFGQKKFVFGRKNEPGEQPPVSNEEAIELEFKLAAEKSSEDFVVSSPENLATPLATMVDEEVSDNPFEKQFGKPIVPDSVLSSAPEKAGEDFARTKVTDIQIENTQDTSAVALATGQIPKSLFSTFATGTGREIDIEDIKKIDFSSLEGAGGFYDYDDDETSYADEIPEGTYLSFNEFSQKTDRQDVAKGIADTKLSVFVRSAIIVLVTIGLLYVSASARDIRLPLPEFMFPTGSTLTTFIMVQILLCVLLIVVCANTVISGIVSLFKMRANSDTLVTFSLIGSILQGFILFKEFRTIDITAVTLLAPVASLVLLFNYIAKLGVLSRIQRNFKVVAANRTKRGLSSVVSPSYCHELLPNITELKPNIVYSSKSDFFSDFLALSFSTKYDVGINRAVAPVCIIGAIMVALVSKFLLDDNVLAATAFAAVLCVCATLSTTFIENIPLGKISKELSRKGAIISGNKAVEDFSDTAGIILTENDLFPRGHVYLNGIKAFPKGRIDQAILDAASVLCVLDGPMGGLFLNMIGGDKKLLKKVDNVVYENNMGLSGWVDGRRVLIGNRMLMQNHGINLPNDSYEKKYPKETPDNPVYVSNSGEVSARFLVEYTPDKDLKEELYNMIHLEKQLIIYTTDSNLTTDRISDLYDYPADLITIMSSELQEAFREMSADKEETPAEIVYTGRPASFIAAISAVISARSSILTGTIFQLIQIIFGYTMVTLMAFTGALASFGSSKIILYLLVWFIVTVLAQKLIKRS